MTPKQIAAGLSEAQRRWIYATPLQQPADASFIAYHAGDTGGGQRFAAFARLNIALFQRIKNRSGSAWTYRLSPLGLAVLQEPKT